MTSNPFRYVALRSAAVLFVLFGCDADTNTEVEVLTPRTNASLFPIVSGPVSASTDVNLEWDDGYNVGYCAEITVSSTVGVSTWQLILFTPEASIFSNWNTLLLETDPVNVLVPDEESGMVVISPGGTAVTGFCAEGSTTPPILIHLSGT